MIEYIIDTSVLIKGYVVEGDSARVRTILNSLQASNPIVLHAPESCLIECASVLWKQARFHGTPLSQVKLALDNLIALPLHIHSANSLLVRALEIGVDHNLPVYDTIYIALAERLKLPLITVDAKQTQVAIANGIIMKPLSDFPEFNP